MKIADQKTTGFTLVEVAIVLIIAGLIMTMLFDTLDIYTKNKKITSTRDKLELVDEQLQLYLEQNGRLPCPAALTDDFDSPTYGFETSTNCLTSAVAPGTSRTTGTGGRTVRIGMVPTRTLNLPDEFALDGWNNRIVYAVTEVLAADPADFDRYLGAISVVDRNNNNILPGTGAGHYVVVSTGRNDDGGFGPSGAVIGTCADAATMEGENCNGDAVFRKTLITSDNGGADSYDDLIVARAMSAFGQGVPTGATVGFDLPACPSGWVPVVTSVPCAIDVDPPNPAENITCEVTPTPTLIYCRKT